MLASYSGGSLSQSLQSDHSFAAGHQYSPHQIASDGYPRVLQSTSENIQPPNHFNHGQGAYSKSRPPRGEPQAVGSKRLLERLDLPPEHEIVYEAIVTKKFEKGEKGGRSSGKDSKETRQLYKNIPAAASTTDCKQNNDYYKYRMSGKRETCSKPWCKANNPHVLWPEDAEKSFQFWIRTILPMGKKKVYAKVFNRKEAEFAKSCQLPPVARKQCGRNELISYMIYLDTGLVRDRKQISSHIQVLRGRLNRVNNNIFFKDDGTPAAHDECATIYEKWDKLRWDEGKKRIVPDPDPKKSDLRSSYLASSQPSEYNSYRMPDAYSGIVEPGRPRFKEMHFCLYVTHKNDPNDSPLHTYTIAQQSTSAEARQAVDIPDLHRYFPLVNQLSDDPIQDQLFFCEASLRMRHDLTEKGYQVGPDMKAILICPPDYRDWRVRATGYRGRGAEPVKSDERHCGWERAADGQVHIVLWASAAYWAQLLADCRLAYEGRLRPSRDPTSPNAFAFTDDPTARAEEVLEQASFVQEIFATRGPRHEEVRIAILLWRFRQATDNEDVGLWTWRKIERHADGSQVPTTLPMDRYQSFHHGPSLVLKSDDREPHEVDMENFDFSNLDMPMPERKVPGSLMSSRRAPSLDWNNLHLDTRLMQHENLNLDQNHSRTDVIHENAQEDANMDIDSATQEQSFPSHSSSAYPHSPHMPMHSQENAFSFDMNGNIDVSLTEWENLDFNVIPGLETPAKQAERHNLASQQRSSDKTLTLPSALRGADDMSFPIDPALSAWGTPATRAGSVDGTALDTPSAQLKHSFARALTYLPPVSESHILKSTREDIGSIPDQSETPAQQNYEQASGQVAWETTMGRAENELDGAEGQDGRAQTHSPLESYRPRSDAVPVAQVDELDDQVQDQASIATQSFHSIDNDECGLQFEDQESCFVTEPVKTGVAMVGVENFEDVESFKPHPQDVQSDNEISWHHVQDYGAGATQTQPTSQMDQPNYSEAQYQYIRPGQSQNYTPDHPQAVQPSLSQFQAQPQPSSQSQSQSQSQPQPSRPEYSFTFQIPQPPQIAKASRAIQALSTPQTLHQPHPTHPQHHPSSPSSAHSLEEICGDAAQLAALSSYEVCADGSNLAQLAQIHAASLRGSFDSASASVSASSSYASYASGQRLAQYQPNSGQSHSQRQGQSQDFLRHQRQHGFRRSVGPVRIGQNAHLPLGPHVSRSSSRNSMHGAGIHEAGNANQNTRTGQLSRTNSMTTTGGLRWSENRRQSQRERERGFGATTAAGRMSRARYAEPAMSGPDALLTAAEKDRIQSQSQSHVHAQAAIARGERQWQQSKAFTYEHVQGARVDASWFGSDSANNCSTGSHGSQLNGHGSEQHTSTASGGEGSMSGLEPYESQWNLVRSSSLVATSTSGTTPGFLMSGSDGRVGMEVAGHEMRSDGGGGSRDLEHHDGVGAVLGEVRDDLESVEGR